jgi:hypothetical protein
MSAVCAHLDSVEVRSLPDEIASCEDRSWCYVDEVTFVLGRL